MDGKFNTMDKIKKEDEQRPKFNFVCIGNVKDSKTRIVVSKKAQIDQKWSTTTLKNALIELPKKSMPLSVRKRNTKE